MSGDAGTLEHSTEKAKQGRLRETDENVSARLYCNVSIVDIIYFLPGFELEYGKEGVMVQMGGVKRASGDGGEETVRKSMASTSLYYTIERQCEKGN